MQLLKGWGPPAQDKTRAHRLCIEEPTTADIYYRLQSGKTERDSKYQIKADLEPQAVYFFF